VSGRAPEAERLLVDLQRSTLHALRRCYDDLNAAFFRRQLRRPVIALSASTTRLGQWLRLERTIEVGWQLLTTQSWSVALEVLKHEMAHQYVDEVLSLVDETAHGPAFRGVCEARGIDGRASGAPVVASYQNPEGRVLSRVAKLLALAKSPNLHEAQAAALAAQRLMLKYNLGTVSDHRPRDYGFCQIGAPTGRTTESERILAAIIDEHFFVDTIWVPVWRPLQGKRGCVIEICGTPENLEYAAYAHAFLTHTAEQLWRDYRRAQKIRRNQDRRSFLAGVMTGFREQLVAQQRTHQQEGLVWVGDADLERYFRRRHPHIRHTRHVGRHRGDAYGHGREAGQRIVMHRPIAQGSSSETRLLPGRR
jgi:hypothetical protein